MKRTLLAFFMLAAAFTSYAQTNLVKNGDFEEWNFSNGNPTHWEDRHPAALVEKSSDAQSGDYSAKMDIDDFSYGVGWTGTSTYKINLVAGKTYQCSFYYKVTKGDFTEVSMALSHTPTGEFWPQELARAEASNHTLNTWHKVDFIYTANDTKDITLKVYARTADKMTILVDNVRIEDAASSGIGTDGVEQSVNVYPNPSSDYITVDADIETVGFYSLDGKLVKSVDIKSTSDKTINITSLANGIYILKLYKDGKVSQTKLTKK